jgi:DUF4097 and DUF4098 domain-containing protein YvlB
MATHHTPDGVRLKLRISAGRCEIETADTTETVVETEPMNGSAASREAADAMIEKLSSRSEGGHTLLVEMPKQRGLLSSLRGAQVLVRIRAPHGADLDGSTASADIVVRGRVGATGVSTASGDVTIENAEQAAEVATASGDVKVRALGAGGSVNTMSGDVTVGETSGTLSVNTMSGDVKIERVATGAIQVRSMSGDVRAGIARGATLFVDADSKSGDVSSELPVTGETPAAGHADVELRASSMSGDILVARAPENVAAGA